MIYILSRKIRRYILTVVLLNFICTTIYAAEEIEAIKHKLIGTWKLVSMTREMLDTGQKSDDYGPNPIGYINYSPEGRMIAIIVRSDRKKPKVKPDDQRVSDQDAIALYRSMSSYAGTYTVEKDRVIHHVEVSWNQLWTGTDQVRYFKFDGDKLTLTMKPFMTPLGKQTVHLTWKKLNS